MFGQNHIVAASHIDRVTKGGVIKEFETEKLLQLARDMENCQMNLSKLGYHADINLRGNMTAVVLRLPRYLRSEWAKEAQITRDQGKEPDFPQLTKSVRRKARLANTEYGRLINTRSGVEGENTKIPYSGRHTCKASSFTLSGTINDGNSSLSGCTPVKPKCIFCKKDGHNIGKCFKFQEKTYDERKSFVSKNGLCNLCLSKGHYVNKCRKTHGCLVPGCGKRHHPMLHPVSTNSAPKADRSTQGATAQTGHCGATGTLKKPER
ncbi:uncharacterized protein LOC114535462 [Dendronephthya gigantea]|uniref:uncharacterized protein LOC114535462 n=1 Tax=Dendronephthya gigantea TaxID=151771 RepID=UPI00106B82C2|nr:uncharacterized protein LOC114535462 [Dendronephthya gigantea]